MAAEICSVTGFSDASWGSPVDPFTTPPGYLLTPPDVFVAALDTNGSLVWNTFVGSSEQNYNSDIALDGSGNSYVTANTPGTSYTSFATFVAKLDSNGALAWKTFRLPLALAAVSRLTGRGTFTLPDRAVQPGALQYTHSPVPPMLLWPSWMAAER